MNFKQVLYIIISSALLILFIFLSILFIPSAPSVNSNQTSKIIHFVSHISPAQKELIDLFNKKNRGRILVKPIDLPFEKFSTNERKELLARFLRSKSDRIDVFTVDQIWVPRFVKWSEPLGQYVSEEERKNLLKFAMETCYDNNTLVTLPLYLDVSVLYYRIDLLKSIDKNQGIISDIDKSVTWEEMINIYDKSFRGYNPYFLFPADDYEGLMCMFWEMLKGLGSDIFINSGLNLKSSEIKKSLQMMVDLVNKYGITPESVVNRRENECITDFLQDDGIFLRSWPGLLTDHRFQIKDTTIRNQIIKAPTPHFSEGKPVSVFGGWNLMVSKFSRNIPESIEFVKFLISENSQRILHDSGGFLPIYKPLYDEGDTELDFYYKLFEQGVHRPIHKNYTNISDILSYYFNLAIKGDISVDEALVMAEEKIKTSAILEN